MIPASACTGDCSCRDGAVSCKNTTQIHLCPGIVTCSLLLSDAVVLLYFTLMFVFVSHYPYAQDLM